MQRLRVRMTMTTQARVYISHRIDIIHKSDKHPDRLGRSFDPDFGSFGLSSASRGHMGCVCVMGGIM